MRIESNINPLTNSAYSCSGTMIDLKIAFHGVNHEMLIGILACRLKKYHITPLAIKYLIRSPGEQQHKYGVGFRQCEACLLYLYPVKPP